MREIKMAKVKPFQAVLLHLILCSYLLSVNGVFWNDLRLHFNLLATNGFFREGRTIPETELKGWQLIDNQTECDQDQFVGFRYEDPSDDGVVLLYDINGIIAGIQARFPHDSILSPGNLHRFDLVPMFQNITESNGQTYFILTAYFIHPEFICEVGRNETDLIEEGTGTGLWFQNGSTPLELIEVPLDRPTAISQKWSKNRCFPAMGYHNFYDVESFTPTNCTEMQPTFLLFNKKDELHGFGFKTPGYTESKYFEHPPTFVTSLILGEPVPQCILDINDEIGTTAIHVYFVDNPWFINCL